MRRMLAIAAAVTATVLAGTTPASAASRTTGGDGWVPAPSSPWSVPAGARCDFAVTGEPIVDEVRKRVLAAYPDGSPRSELWVGDLVIRVTNAETGEYYDADASGRAVIEYAADGGWAAPPDALAGSGSNWPSRARASGPARGSQARAPDRSSAGRS